MHKCYEENPFTYNYKFTGEKSPMPEITCLPAFDLMTGGIREDDDDERDAED